MEVPLRPPAWAENLTALLIRTTGVGGAFIVLDAEPAVRDCRLAGDPPTAGPTDWLDQLRAEYPPDPKHSTSDARNLAWLPRLASGLPAAALTVQAVSGAEKDAIGLLGLLHTAPPKPDQQRQCEAVLGEAAGLAQNWSAASGEVVRSRKLADERRAALRASLDTEALLIDYLMTATDGVWHTDQNHRFISTTTDLSTLRVAQDRVIGKTVWELARGDVEKDAIWIELHRIFENQKPFRGFEYSLRDDMGQQIWREVNGNPVFDSAGKFSGFRGTSRDVTQRKQSEIALREMNSRFAALAGAGIVGVIVGEGDWVIEANDEFLRIVGASRGEIDRGPIHTSRLSSVGDASEAGLRRALRMKGVWGPKERDILRMDGSRVPALLSLILLDADRHRWMGLVQDITERKQTEARIRELADRDTLTGLLNRRSFLERFSDSLAGPVQGGEGGALILLDLDHFKDVNDTLGHDAGDHLLCEVAGRLTRSVRSHDAVARLGGDEFAVLLAGTTQAEEVDAVGRRILDQLRRPFMTETRLLHATASAGVVLFPRDGTDAKQLFKNADIALYRSKARGRRTLVFFDSAMLSEYEDRVALDAELQRALHEDEFMLAFQPTLRLDDRTHCGFEALLRWRHPQRGLLPPASFVANLEETGLIVAVGRFIFEAAFRQFRLWLDQGLDPGHIAINTASAQLRQGDLVREVERQLASFRLDPSRLRIEITENVLLEDSPEIAATLEGLHQLGVGIALDDFGTGFASLSHLKRVPVNVLKIDRSFVRDIGVDADDAAISRTIITLAHSLGMTVVAEGVATEEALAFLRLNGCDEAQGYLFARPLPSEQADHYLRQAAHNLHQTSPI